MQGSVVLVQVVSLCEVSEACLNASKCSMSGFNRAWRREKWRSMREKANCGFAIVGLVSPLQLAEMERWEIGGAFK